MQKRLSSRAVERRFRVSVLSVAQRFSEYWERSKIDLTLFLDGDDKSRNSEM